MQKRSSMLFRRINEATISIDGGLFCCVAVSVVLCFSKMGDGCRMLQNCVGLLGSAIVPL